MPAEEPATSLEDLYDAVPQAEELDLREELEREVERRYWLRKLRPLLGALDLDLDDDTENRTLTPDAAPQASHEEPEPWHLSDSQVVGMIEHVLGAEPLDDDVDRGH